MGESTRLPPVVEKAAPDVVDASANDRDGASATPASAPWAGRRVVTISHGTTGTHSVFCAAHDLGLPAVHFHLLTYPYFHSHYRPGELVPDGCPKRYMYKGESRTLPPCHSELLAKYMAVKENCVGASGDARQCHFGTAWATDAERLVRAAAHLRISVGDTPYPYFPHALASAPFGDANTTFVHLPRDAVAWAASRKEHHGNISLMCSRELWQRPGGAGGGAGGDAERAANGTAPFSPLDLSACARRCEAAGRQPTQCLEAMSSVPTADVAAAFAANEALLASLFAARPNYVAINLFDPSHPHDTADIAQSIRLAWQRRPARGE